MTDKTDVLDPEQEIIENAENEMEMGPNGQEKPEAQSTEASKLADLEKQLEEAKSKYLYLMSDFQNFRRNTANERIELMQTAGRDILAAMIPVLDDFDRAAKNNALTEGTTLVHQKLVNLLKTKGLSMMETNAGDDFNADFHDALAEIPAPTEELKGKIVDIIEPGYLLADKIIRFAKVVVGK